MHRHRNAIIWKDFYDLMKDSFCEHITIDKEKEERFFVKKSILCEKCYKKFIFYSDLKNVKNREIGINKVF